MRSILWLIGLLLGIVAIALVILAISASLSLDREFGYSGETDALPEFPSVSTSNLTRISAGEFTFRARLAGFDNTGPSLILLHGFPETSAMWTPLMAAAASQGYRVLAFDQRGYSPAARPAEPSAYAMSELIDDVIRVADAVGFQRFHLVGHDWGSAVGWGTLMAHSERVISWSSLSIPHPSAFVDAFQHDPEQRKRSRYFLLFQQSWLPEQLFAFNDHMLLREVFYAGMSESQSEEYLSAFSEPGAMTAALNWYRALDLPGQAFAGEPDIHRPVLFLWGSSDPSVSPYTIEAQKKYLKGPFREVKLDAGHWLMEERTEAVVSAVLKQIREAEKVAQVR